MKYFLSILFLAFGFSSNAQTWTNVYSNQKIDGVWANKNFRMPTDTVVNKTGVALIGTKFWIGNGTNWTLSSVDTGRGSSQIATGGTLKKVLDSAISVTIPAQRLIDSMNAVQSRLNTKEPLLGFIPENPSNKGANNGYAALGSDGRVPSSQLPFSSVVYKGTWNANTNTPTLADGTGTAGWMYVCSFAGTVNLGSGSVTYSVGDQVIYSGSIWQKVTPSVTVSSVNGFTGTVVLTTNNIAESGTNYYWTAGRTRSALDYTNTGTSGAATYDYTNGIFNFPNYTISGLGGVAVSDSAAMLANYYRTHVAVAALALKLNISDTAAQMLAYKIKDISHDALLTALVSDTGTLAARFANVLAVANSKEPIITGTTSADYWRGDKTFATLNKAAVGLSNVDNTSDANKPISSATIAALALKFNISDSAAAFLAYKLKDIGHDALLAALVADSATLPARFTNVINLANSKVAKSDSALMLDPYKAAFISSSFDTTSRVLTLRPISGSVFSILIPRGSASGATGISALSNSKSGNLVDIAGDNGSHTQFSINDADSLTRIHKSDTTSLIPTKAWVTNQLYNKLDFRVFGNIVNSGIGDFTASNIAITAGTKTKITYDTKGLVTAGADATTADIAASTNKNYVTDAQAVVIGNTSGTNSGDNAVNSNYSSLVSNANHTGDATGSTVLTLATVNANVGTFGSASQVPVYTVNAKGLVTGVTNTSIAIAESQVTNLVTDLAAKSPTAGNTSLVTVGPITTGSWTATAIGVGYGGTGATTAAGARTNLGLVIGTDVLAYRTFGSAANSASTDFATYNQVHYVGTTSIAANRTSGTQTLTGVSIDGNSATTSQTNFTALTVATVAVVVTTDSRMSDSRNAADVYSWAKAVSKPTYAYSEITGTPTIPTVYTWAQQATKPSYTYSEIGGSVPTWNQNTTGTAYNITQYTINQNLGTANSPTFVNGTFSGGVSINNSNIANNGINVRYNSSNGKIGLGVANSNGFSYLGYNVNSASGTDNGTYDLSAPATRFRMDGGLFQFETAADGIASNTITWASIASISAGGTIKTKTGSGETLIAGSLDVNKDIGLASGYGLVSGGARVLSVQDGYAVKVNGTFGVTGALTGNNGIAIYGPDATASILYRYIGGTNNPGLYVSTTESTKTINLSVGNSTGGGVLAIGSPLTGTSATFTSLNVNNNTGGVVLNRAATSNYVGTYYQTATTSKWFVGMRENLSQDNYVIYSETTGSDAFRIAASNNAVTLSSSASSSSSSTGAVVVAGGVGIGGALNVGSYLDAASYKAGGVPILGYSSTAVQLAANSYWQSLELWANGSSRLGISSTGVITASNLAGTGDRMVVANASGVLSATNAAPTSGTYTPTATNSSNCSSINVYSCRYTRVGNIVTVSGMIEPVVTSSATLSAFVITLPIDPTSSFSNLYDLNGTGSFNVLSTSNVDPVILAGLGEKRAYFSFYPGTYSGTNPMSFTFSYSL